MKRNACLLLFILMAAVFLSACAKAPSGPSDALLGDAVRGKFSTDEQIKSAPIEVKVDQGAVTLRGSVANEEIRVRAVEIAKSVEGVHHVNDQLAVSAAEMTPAVPQEAVQPDTQEPAEQKIAPPVEQPAPAKEPSSVTPPASALPVPEPAAPTPAPPPPPRKVTLAAGQEVQVKILDPIDSKVNQVGELFRASLHASLMSGKEVVVPQGTQIYIRLIESKTHGKIKGRSELEVTLDHMKLDGKSYALNSSTYGVLGESRGNDTAKKTAIGGVVGGVIGAIAGGKKGAAIGAGVGAGAGMTSQLFLKGEQVKIPAETPIFFELAESVTITLPGKP